MTTSKKNERLERIARDKSPIGRRSVGRPRKRWCDNLMEMAETEEGTVPEPIIEEWRRRRRRFEIKYNIPVCS